MGDHDEHKPPKVRQIGFEDDFIPPPEVPPPKRPDWEPTYENVRKEDVVINMQPTEAEPEVGSRQRKSSDGTESSGSGGSWNCTCSGCYCTGEACACCDEGCCCCCDCLGDCLGGVGECLGACCEGCGECLGGCLEGCGEVLCDGCGECLCEVLCGFCGS